MEVMRPTVSTIMVAQGPRQILGLGRMNCLAVCIRLPPVLWHSRCALSSPVPELGSIGDRVS